MRRSFVTFLSLLLFLSVLVLGSAILSKNSSAVPPPNESAARGATEMHWAFIRPLGESNIRVEHASHPSITAEFVETGLYAVTFPSNFKVLACTATIAGTCGIIEATPGKFDHRVEDNEVKIKITNPLTCLSIELLTGFAFTIVAYSKRGAK